LARLEASSSMRHTLELSDSCNAARNALTSALYSSPVPLAPSLQQPNHPHQPPPPYQQHTQPGSTPQPQTSPVKSRPGPPRWNPHPAGAATPNSYMPSCDGRIPARTPSTPPNVTVFTQSHDADPWPPSNSGGCYGRFHSRTNGSATAIVRTSRSSTTRVGFPQLFTSIFPLGHFTTSSSLFNSVYRVQINKLCTK